MYDTNFRCTYNLIEDKLDSETLYRIQYLQAFELEDWDGEKINKALIYITDLLKNNEKGKNIMKKMSEKLNIVEGQNLEVLFLLTYDYFYLTHECIIDLINTSNISEERYNNLIEENSKIKFYKEYENGKKCNYKIGLISNDITFDNKFNYIDKFGRNVSISSNEFTIIKVSDYHNEELIFDIGKNQKISYDELFSILSEKNNLKLVSKLNNKIIIQSDEQIRLFSLKNESDSERLFEILSQEQKRAYIMAPEVSIEQRKYLYNLLENYGFDKGMLYRKSTTYPRE